MSSKKTSDYLCIWILKIAKNFKCFVTKQLDFYIQVLNDLAMFFHKSIPS